MLALDRAHSHFMHSMGSRSGAAMTLAGMLDWRVDRGSGGLGLGHFVDRFG